MIYEFSPYSLEGDYGKACNQYCAIVPNDEDWIAIKDGDVMHLTPKWGHVMQNAIDTFPNTGIFTCYTNRVKPKKHIARLESYNDPSMATHRNIAIELVLNPIPFSEFKRVISGHFMLFKKSTWNKVGGFKEGKILGVDNNFSWRVLMHGMKIRNINTMYVMHYYRFNEGIESTDHLS
jgi:GT2 family glycosyltransferase